MWKVGSDGAARRPIEYDLIRGASLAERKPFSTDGCPTVILWVVAVEATLSDHSAKQERARTPDEQRLLREREEEIAAASSEAELRRPRLKFINSDGRAVDRADWEGRRPSPMPDETPGLISDEAEGSDRNNQWGSLLDAVRLIIAQSADGERLSRLVIDEPSLAFLYRNKYAEVRTAFEHAVSKIEEWLKQGLVEGEGFHEDTGTRSSITQREWQSRVIKICENRLINPLRGTRETYPWITDIEIHLEKVVGLANSQQAVAKVTEPSPGRSAKPTEADIDRAIKSYVFRCLTKDMVPVPDTGKFQHGCDTALKVVFSGIRYGGIGRRLMRNRFYKILAELGLDRVSGRKKKIDFPKLRARAEELWAEDLDLKN